MKARWTLAALCAGLTGLVGLAAFPVAQADRRGGDFSDRVAGTYFGMASTEGGGPFLDTITYHADGTYAGTNTDGDPTDGWSLPEHGVWKRIGRREIASTSLVYILDAEGVLNFIFRVHGVGSFSRDFDEVRGSFTIDVFLPDQDPLNDAPVAMDAGVFEFRRLPVME